MSWQSCVRRFAFGAVMVLGAAACSKDSPAARGQAQRVAMVSDAREDFELASTSYKPSTSPMQLGTLVGTVDSTALPALDDETHECETGKETPPHSRAALVWIDGLNSGKPLPVDKRADLASEDCGLDPSIVATTVGSTVNVYNDDAALHRLVFKGPAVDGSVTMPFFNTGQIVASEKLTKRVGFVDVTCALHPWTHATIAVFDHPYYAVTDEHGRFSLDSVPAGSYTLMVWRPDLEKPLQRHIQILPQRTTSLTIGPSGAAPATGHTDVADIASGMKRSTTIAAKSKAR